MAILERIECRICGMKKQTRGRDETNSLRSTLDQYSRAGETERLYLWLQHRDLRDEFCCLAAMLD